VDKELIEYPGAFGLAEISADFSQQRLRRKDEELNTATHILCPSEFVEKSIVAAGMEPDRISTIPLGTDNGWVPAELPKEPVFLYVGNITARKGVHRLIRAWHKLKAYRTTRLRLIGDLRLPVEFLSEYRNSFEHLPRIGRDRLIPEYSRARAFIFNALADGFGHVFAEAMVCATPVLASRNCGAPDLIDDGVEGRLFEYGDDEQLMTVLDWALRHPTELLEMGRLARERALQWGWNEFGAAFLAWFNGAIAAER
jgi:glycosyltransferase involved in cell wall biosynthesis